MTMKVETVINTLGDDYTDNHLIELKTKMLELERV